MNNRAQRFCLLARTRLVLGLSLLVACGAAGSVVSPETPLSVPVHLPPPGHPSLFLTASEVATVRERCHTQAWARAIGSNLVVRAEALLAAKPDIPHSGGQWAGHYVCPNCGVQLKAVSATEHVCPKCGRTFSGGIYDAAGVAERHRARFADALTLAQAYVLEPRPEYAQRVRDILAEYASFYTHLPLHDFLGHTGTNALARGARLTAQTLDESGLLVQAVWAYDLVYDAPCFTPADRQHIETGLIRPLVATIQRNPWGRLNWQAAHNAALMSAGLLLRDQALVDQALNDPENGFLFQMREGVLGSGMWYEGAVGYHYFALNFHIHLLEAAARAGMDLYSLPAVRKMFLAPLNLRMPDGTFPPLNDSGRESIAHYRAAYEVAYRRYGDPRFGQLLQPRDTREALFWGAESVPESLHSPTLPLVLPSYPGAAEGLAILRDKTGASALYLDYFKSTAQHTQPVRLHLLLYAQGDIRFVDPATLMYGHPMHEGWGRQTFAHNTVVVNEQIQDQSEGELKAFASGDGWAVARALAKQAYKGVVLDRTVLMHGNVIADIFRCTADAVSTFDLPLHLRGELSGLPASEPLPRLSDQPAYREAKDVRRFGRPLRSFSLGTGAGRRIAVTVFDTSECFEARGYGKDLTDLVPMIVRRQRGKEAVFAAVYQLLDQGEQPAQASAELGPVTVIRLGGSSLAVGQETVVTIDGVRRRCDVGQE